MTLTMDRLTPSRPHPLPSPITLVDLATSTSGVQMDEEELTPAQVAREFKVSPATVRRWEEKGVLAPTRRLPHSGHRRYSRSAVDALKAKINATRELADERGHGD